MNSMSVYMYSTYYFICIIMYILLFVFIIYKGVYVTMCMTIILFIMYIVYKSKRY